MDEEARFFQELLHLLLPDELEGFNQPEQPVGEPEVPRPSTPDIKEAPKSSCSKS